MIVDIKHFIGYVTDCPNTAIRYAANILTVQLLRAAE